MPALKTNKTENQFFHIDAVENAVDSLETAASFLDRHDELKWKWIAFALHHSLYSFCIAALEGGNYENVLLVRQKRTKNKKLKQTNRLIGFWTALERVQDPKFWMGRLSCSKALILTEEERQSVKWLTNRLRNNFMHFVPMSLKVFIPRVKKACLDVLRLIEFLAIESSTILYFETDSEVRMRGAILKLRSELQEN